MKSIAPPIEQGSQARRVLVLAWPAVVEQSLNMAIGLVTVYFVGGLGAAAVAAVGLSEMVVFIGFGMFTAVGAGSTAIVARHIGAGEDHMVSRVIQQSFILAAIAGGSFSLFVVFLAELFLVLLQAKPDVVQAGVTYLRLLGVGLFPFALMYVGASILRGVGDTKTPMKVMMAVIALNTVLSAILVKGAFGIPALDVAGAGIAVSMARTLGGIVMVTIVIRGTGHFKANLFQGLRFDLVQVKRILNVGIPAGLEMVQMNVAQTIFSAVVSSLGTVAFASHVIAMRIEAISFMPGFGMGFAAMTLVGQALGAKRPDEAKRSGYLAQAYSVAMMTFCGATLFIFSEQAVSFFISDPEVISQGSTLIRILSVAQPAFATMNALAGALRGAGDTRWVMAIMTAGIWAGRVPFGFLMAKVLGFGVAGAWFAMVGDALVRGGLIWWRFASGKWQRIIV